ncbi:MAG: hypothetical protein R2828_16875 [Saprospiraceae bacterium]
MTAANFQTYQDSQDALSIANALRTVYVSIKKVLGATFAIVLVAFAIPFVRGLFWLLIRKLKRNYHPRNIQFTTENYASYLKSHEALGKEIEKLQKGVNLNEKEAPWVLRGFIKDLKKLSSLTIKYYNELSKAIDDTSSVQNGEMFNSVSPFDLWKNRNKAYSYKL